MRRSQLNSLQGLIPKALGRPELLRRLAARLVSRNWEDIVGSGLAEKSHPDKFENGTLWIAVSSSVWVQELQLRKGLILERLNGAAGYELFEEVRFGIRPLAKPMDTTPSQFIEPAEVEVVISQPNLEVVARRALGKLKAVAEKQKRLD